MKTQQKSIMKSGRIGRSGLWVGLTLAAGIYGGFAQFPSGLRLADYSTNDGARIVLEWSIGETYTIQYASNLTSLSWSNLGTISLTSTNVGEIIDTGARLVNERYYRTSVGGILNVVGFLNKRIPAGYSMIADPFASGNNAIGEVLPAVPDRCCVWKPSWEFNTYLQGQRWFNTNMVLGAGEGFWIYNPGGEAFTISFKGQVPLGGLNLLRSGFSICSFPVAVDWSFVNCLPLGVPHVVYVLVWSASTSQFLMSTYDPGLGEWDRAPSVSPGEAFYFYTDTGIAWPCSRPVCLPANSPLGCTLDPLLADANHGRITDDHGAPLAGCGFQAAAYVGPMSAREDALVMQVPPVCLGENAFAGYAPILLSSLNSAEPLLMQVRAWEGNDVGSYEDALALNRRCGKSQIMIVPPTVASPPVPLFTPVFANFSIASSVLPLIFGQPTAQTVSPGSQVSLTVQATGSQPLRYQWRFNGADILNATNAALVLTNVQCADIGSYSVVVSNSFGAVTSSAATLSLVSLEMCAVITLCGPAGGQYRVEWADAVATNNWQVLTNVTLPYSPFPIIDLNSTRTHKRFYRTVRLPE